MKQAPRNLDRAREVIADSVLLYLRMLDAECAVEKRFAKRMIKHACRHMEYFEAPFVSKDAQAFATSKGVTDLRLYDWDDQIRVLCDEGRKNLHWEHARQVGDMFDDLAAGPRSRDHVLEVLRSARVAWITKAENRKLSHGKRREWQSEYAQHIPEHIY